MLLLPGLLRVVFSALVRLVWSALLRFLYVMARSRPPASVTLTTRSVQSLPPSVEPVAARSVCRPQALLALGVPATAPSIAVAVQADADEPALPVKRSNFS